MKRLLILLHGLPGAGKSTLASGVAREVSDLYYANLGAHPDFGKRPMGDLCLELYDQFGDGGSLITEGVLRSMSFRDSLVSRILDSAEQRNPFNAAIIFQLVVPVEVLASRRNRSISDYRRMEATTQVGSCKYEYRVFHSSAPEEGSVQRDVERLAFEIEQSRLDS